MHTFVNQALFLSDDPFSPLLTNAAGHYPSDHFPVTAHLRSEDATKKTVSNSNFILPRAFRACLDTRNTNADVRRT